ncbi:hypothetical protein GCM10008965_55540 [Methylorubrum aminovorans]|nr:hypothetical protein GCM10025880_32590 [Methylorubrum aminovorans]
MVLALILALRLALELALEFGLALELALQLGLALELALRLELGDGGGRHVPVGLAHDDVSLHVDDGRQQDGTSIIYVDAGSVSVAV